MIRRMAKVEIVGLKDTSLDVIDTIQELGVLHIEDLSEKLDKMGGRKRLSRMEIDPQASEHETKLNELREKIGEKIRELNPEVEKISSQEIQKEYHAIWSENTDLMISRVEKLLGEVDRDTKEAVERKEELLMELSRLEKYAPMMEKILPLAETVAASENMASIALLIERRFKAILNYLNEEIGKITQGESEVVSADVDEESTAALIVFSRRYLKEVHDFLSVQDVNQVRLPSDLGKKPLDEAVAEVRAKMAEIPPQIEEIESRIREAAKKYSVKLLAARNAVHDRLEAIKAVPKFAQTEQVFVISGWVPEDSVEIVEKTLQDKFGARVVLSVSDVRELEEEEGEEPPVALANNPYVRHFEFIYYLSQYPKYGTVDPTTIFAIFFPFFFGLMVGDIGYGIIIAALGWFVYKKWNDKPLASMLGYMLSIGGAWATFFGILYLELFGDLLEKAFEAWHIHLPLLGSEESFLKFPINRLESFTFMLLVTCGIGFIHISIGLVIGIINGIREGNKKHVMEKAGTLGALTGLVMIVAKMLTKAIPMPVAVAGGIIFIAGFVFSGIGGGMGGIVESIVGAGNILSYSRLIAIGLASVIMAQVANDLSRELWGGTFGVLMGIIVAILLHSLNLVIAMFSPSIHALRLHLVESFGKFFEPANFKYEPFKKSGGE
ncbi:MAG: V-type ATPase 116kDa subunit family protein [Actinomycetota bacterium]|nr:V-type ATPase 116kDa subunit family protein [Actinomycetota bacterium]